MKNKNKKDTSWDNVYSWYNDLLNKDDSYQSKVIAPNLVRFLNIKKNEIVYDLACGQGYFSNIIAHLGAKVIASDISKNLINKAKENSKEKISFYICPAHDSKFLKDKSIDTVVVVLAIQNIQNINDVFIDIKRVLKKEGRIILVLNHPSFRVPKGSDWFFKNDIQHRIINKYMSEMKIFIDMTPGEKISSKKIKTISFHRPLQNYVKVFSKNKLAITRLEEWISHKESENGPRKKAEDNARKEIPMFMCLEIKNI